MSQSERGSWECECLLPLAVQGLHLRPWWRHKATGIARRGGPCTGMLALRTQSGETVCVEGGSRHGSRRPSGRSLQTNRRDGHIERCVSASTSWMGACEGPGSEHAGPRLVVTHRLSLVRWSRGCRTLTSSRLEGPALSRPSPVGPRLLHTRQGHPCSTLRWTECPWTWEDAGRTELRSRVWWSSGTSETAWGALARPPGTVQVGSGRRRRPIVQPDALSGPGKHIGQFWIWLGQRYSSWWRQRSRIVLSRT